MDFYNQGGGGGMGFDLEHQTLPFDELQLSDSEQRAIIAFMKTLTDTNIQGKTGDNSQLVAQSSSENNANH